MSDVERKVGEWLRQEQGEGRARVLAFDVGRSIGEAETRNVARPAAGITASRRRHRGAMRRSRRQAARHLYPSAPEWFVEKLALAGEAFLAGRPGEPGPLLGALVRIAFGDERQPAIEALAEYLLRRLDPYVALLLVECWAVRYVGPAPHEEEVVQIVEAAAIRERQRREGVAR